MRRHIFVYLMVALTTIACFRETGVESLPVSSSTVTEDNTQTLSSGTEATGRVGDYIISNATIQVVLNGSLSGARRDAFLPKSFGNIIDFSSQYEEIFNREISVRNDDGLNQIGQGVNLNKNNPIGYDNVEVLQLDAREARISMTGGVYDMDGSLAAQGASVDGNGRVVGVTVTTTMDLTDLRETESTSESGGDIITEDPIGYLTLTTVITNTSDTALPIFTVHDVTSVNKGAYDTFIPYPNYGYDTTSEHDAYAMFAHLQPRQLNTAHYGFFSLVEDVIRFRRAEDPETRSDLLFAAKTAPGRTQLEAGDAMTFVRQVQALNGGTSQNTSTLATNTAYNNIILEVMENPSPNNAYRSAPAFVGLTVLSGNGRDGVLVVGQINDEDYPARYFDGTQWTDLPNGVVMPLYGDYTPAGSSGSGLVNAYLPSGRYTVAGSYSSNTSTYFADTRAVQERDEDASLVFDTNGDGVFLDVPLTVDPFELDDIDSQIPRGIGVHELGEVFHQGRSYRVVEPDQRVLHGRVRFERLDGASFSIGRDSSRNQGSTLYVEGSNGVTAFLPVGDYEALITRGPLYSVNVVPISSVDSTAGEENINEDGEGDGDGSNDDDIIFTLRRAIDFDGWFSADFDVRAYGDPLGEIYEANLITWAYGEDLDVLFYANTNNRPSTRAFFEGTARVLGSFDTEDQDADVDSLFDELAWSLGSATVGRVNADYPDRGRFAVLNIPDEDTFAEFELPLMETGPAEWFDRVRGVNEDMVIQATRPRAPRGFETGFLTAIAEMSGLPAGTPIPSDNPYLQQASPTGSGTTWTDFDLIQLLPGNRYDEYLLARADWFNMLDAGIFVPATGGSSQSSTDNLALGAVRTFVRIAEQAKRDNDLTEFWTNAKAGASFVTNGPLITASVNGVSYGESTTATGQVTVNVTVEAAPWIPVSELRYILNGEVVQAKTLNINRKETTRFEETVTLTLPAGRAANWLVIEAGATLAELNAGEGVSGTFGRVNKGHLPVAFTNPIFINQ